jgi:hypothetical protein
MTWGRRAQSSFEFVAIVGILFMIVIGSLALIQAKANSIIKDRNDVLVNSVSNLITTEIRLAASVEGDYYRQFEMPYYVEGNNYTITRGGPGDFEVSIEESRHIVFLNENSTGDFVKGTNVIRKTSGTITINS